MLFESGYYKNCDFIILVCAPYEGRIDRLIKRDNLSRLEIVKRINLQWSDQKKTDLSDFNWSLFSSLKEKLIFFPDGNFLIISYKIEDVVVVLPSS